MKKIFFDGLNSKEDLETAITEMGLRGFWCPDEMGGRE